MANVVTWENGIRGWIKDDEWLNVPFRPPVIENDPTDILFSSEKTDNLRARWHTITSEQLIPSMAQFHAFDTEARKTVSPVLDNHVVEKGLIKVKQNQSERLRALEQSGVTADDQLYRYTVEDVTRLANQVYTRAKVGLNEVLATGKMTIAENGVGLTVDYGLTDEQKSLTLTITNESDVPAQIEDIVDFARERGVILTGMVCSRKILSKLKANKSMQTVINGNLGQGATVRNADLNNYLADEFGITNIYTNDGIYNANNEIVDPETGRLKVEQHRYFPKDKITFFASPANGRLGVGLWGNPPEVTNRLTNTTTTGVSPYVYIHQWTEHDPAVLWTKASGLFIPVLYNPTGMYIVTVTDNGV
ncbi:MAG: major capsid protein [Ruminococcus sp.]|nr:major capsid protein [Ruminococcus sp.]